MIHYIQGVCNKLSVLHSVLSFACGFLLITAIVVYAIDETVSDETEDQAEKEKLKYVIMGSIIVGLYNIILYIFIPTF